MGPEREWWSVKGVDEATPIFAQVATVGEGGEPQVRTVHVRYLEKFDCLGINTNKGTNKWKALLKKPLLAGCYFDVAANRQIRWEGDVQLIEEDDIFLNQMWALVEKGVRKVYWMKEGLPEHDLSVRCPTFGTILCFPKVWDIYQIDAGDSSRSTRTLYRESNGWKPEEEISVASHTDSF